MCTRTVPAGRAAPLVALFSVLSLAAPGIPSLPAVEVADSGSRREPLDRDWSLAQRVLIAEARGDLSERERLAEMLRRDRRPGVLGHSLKGRLRLRSGWKSVEESIAANQQSSAIDRYERFRSEQPDTVEGHVRVARWCRSVGLGAQESAHWQQVLLLDPNHRQARAALGHQWFGGSWVSPQEWSQLEEEVTQLRASLNRHGRNLMRIYAEMMSDRQSRREEAAKKLFALNSSDAIPAVGAIFAAAPSPQIDYAIEWLGERENPAAAAVLARWAVDHPLESPRRGCAEELKEKPLYHYVPLLLERLRSPRHSSLIPSLNPDGSLAGVRHVISGETPEQHEIAVSGSLNQPLLTPSEADGRRGSSSVGGASEQVQQGEFPLRNALLELQARAATTRGDMQRQWIAAAESLTTHVVNDRIRRVLAQAAGTDPEATPRQLWNWWSEYTDRDYDPIVLTSKRSSDYRIRLSPSGYSSEPPRLFPPPPSSECFVAGTMVITARGRRPIESILVGDHVLAKEVDTGQLVWDSVVRTTAQPPKPLVTIRTSQDEFTCTRGHLFWVSGKGWTKARYLEEGDVLHGFSSPSVVTAVEPADAEPTYNLVTGHYQNYFVGEGGVLSHDFTEPTPTALRVPGLSYTVHEQVTLGEGTREARVQFGRGDGDLLGARVEPLNPETANPRGSDEQTTGLVIVEVEAGSPAAESGLEVGAVVLSVNGQPVESVEEMNEALRVGQTGGRALQLIIRRGEIRALVVIR